MITMARHRTLSLLGLILITALFLSSTQDVSALSNVYGWGIEGDPKLGLGFDVWANVTDDAILNDDDPGVKNVTVHVSGPNMTINNLMTFNGTFYTGSVPAFPNDGSFNVYILAYNMTDHPRTSYNVVIVFESDPGPVIDPTVTMPVVVGSSLALMVVVFGLATVYDKRRLPEEQVTQPDSES